MTREEAKQWILEHMPPDDDTKQSQAMAMAIQALSSWEEYSDKLWKEAYERGKTEALSQEPQCTEHPCLGTLCRYYKEPCDDTISRILKRMWNCRGKHTTSIDKVKMEQIIRDELPSVTFKSIECDDVVSREAVIKMLAGMIKDRQVYFGHHGEIEYSCGFSTFKFYVEQLPPVTQKSGKWDRSCTCSVCGNWRILESEKNSGKYKFCPNCGAKMVEPQESEDKYGNI